MDNVNSVSILVENNSRYHILSAEGDGIISMARIVRDPKTDALYLDVMLDGSDEFFEGEYLRVAAYGDIEDVFEEQEIPPEDDAENVIGSFQSTLPEVNFRGRINASSLYANDRNIGVLIEHLDNDVVETMQRVIDLTLRVVSLENMPTYDGETEDVLIGFTIEEYDYQAVGGMTWGEWVDSEYNTGWHDEPFIMDGEDVYLEYADAYVNDSDGNRVIDRDLIIAGGQYVIEYAD